MFKTELTPPVRALSAFALMCFSASAAIDEKSYVQEGLYAQWDGVVNAGYDESGNPIHDSNASNWVDLTGNGHTLTSGPAPWPWDDNALHFTTNHTAIKPCFRGELDYTSLTIDFYCYSETTSPSGYIFYTDPFYYDEAAKKSRNAYVNFVPKFTVCVPTYEYSLSSTTGGRCGHAAIYNGNTAGLWYQGRTDYPYYTATPDVTPDSSGERTFYVGSSNANESQFKGKLHSLRIYTRPLTKDEATWNNMIDRIRFGGASSAVQLTVTSTDGTAYGTSTPAYGAASVADGTLTTFSLAGLETSSDDGARAIAVDEGVRGRFLGWRFERGVEGTALYGATNDVTESPTLKLENLYATFAWDIQREVRVVATAMDHGKVAVDDGAAAATALKWYGETCTLKAVPDEGYAFSIWTGSTAGLDVSNPELVLPADRVRELTATFVSASREPKSFIWQGGASGRWADPANWGGDLPIAGDTVTLNAEEGELVVTLEGPLPRLAALNVGTAGEGTATVSVVGWESVIQADAVHVGAAGRIATLDAQRDGALSTNRVWIAAGTMTIDAGGAVSADASGFVGTNGPCWKVVFDENQAKHSSDIKYLWGAAYGGEQSYPPNSSHVSQPSPYGSLTEPTDLGSGGNMLSHSGGGAIRIEVEGALTVNGRLSADAEQTARFSGSHAASFGTGGSVWVTCATLAGTGTVSAASGNHYTIDTNKGLSLSGGSSGGRIALHYGSAAGATLTLDAHGSVAHGGSARITSPAYPGTIYCSDDTLLSAERVSGEWHSPTAAANGVTLAGGTWTNPQLGFRDMAVTVEGDLALEGEAAGAHGLFLSNVAFTVTGSLTLDAARLMTRGGKVTVAGDFTQMTADQRKPRLGGEFMIYAMPTNDPTALAGAEVEIGGHWRIKSGTTCQPNCHPSNGSIVRFAAGRVTVEANASINAAERGYAHGLADGSRGFGPGCGSFKNTQNGGSGHAGYGGGPISLRGAPYGCETDPVTPGTGSGYTHQGNAKNGGGVVYLRVKDKLRVDGAISADGNADIISTVRSGGSSGGSVNIRARKVFGEGTITALGGARNGCGGNGSGGRIAIYTASCPWWGDTSTHVSAAARMPTDYAYSDVVVPAENGTVYWSLIPGNGFLIFTR